MDISFDAFQVEIDYLNSYKLFSEKKTYTYGTSWFRTCVDSENKGHLLLMANYIPSIPFISFLTIDSVTYAIISDYNSDFDIAIQLNETSTNLLMADEIDITVIHETKPHNALVNTLDKMRPILESEIKNIIEPKMQTDKYINDLYPRYVFSLLSNNELTHLDYLFYEKDLNLHSIKLIYKE